MSNWINKLENEDRQKVQSDEDRKTIFNQSRAIIADIVQKVKTDVEEVNRRLFNGRDTFQVEEQRYSETEARKSEFSVFTQVLPAAYLYVYFDYTKSALTRTMVTVADQNSTGRKRTLPDIEIKLAPNGTPYFQFEGKTIVEDEITEQFILPAVQFHKEGR
ncbi:MAG TPA: hypothetical protein VGC97_08690 [Pyrinomonadaceae bacterium]|jgi:hypothetical protein